MREEVADRDLPPRRDQPRKPSLDRIVEPQLAVLDEPQHQRRDERLRDAADAKPRVGAHRDRAPGVGEASRLATRFPFLAHYDEGTRRPGGDHPVEQRPQLGLVVAARRDPSSETSAIAAIATTLAASTRRIALWPLLVRLSSAQPDDRGRAPTRARSTARAASTL